MEKIKCTKNEAYTYESNREVKPVLMSAYRDEVAGLVINSKVVKLREIAYFGYGDDGLIAHVPSHAVKEFSGYLESLRAGKIKLRDLKEESKSMALCQCEKKDAGIGEVKPVRPVDPPKPVKPVKPEKPKPVKPEKPKPAKPEKPKPAKPAKPAKPEKPEKPEKPKPAKQAIKDKSKVRHESKGRSEAPKMASKGRKG